MRILNWLSKSKPKQSLADFPLFYEDYKPNPILVATAKRIDIKTFKKIKFALKDKATYRKTIAEFYGISRTTLNIIRKSPSFKQYKLNRNRHSKPEKYT